MWACSHGPSALEPSTAPAEEHWAFGVWARVSEGQRENEEAALSALTKQHCITFADVLRNSLATLQ